MNIQKLIDLTKSGDLNINLTFRVVTKATRLLKKFAVATKTTSEELVKLFNEDNLAFFGKINAFIAEEYDEEKDDYGDLSKNFFKLIREITKTKKHVEDIQFFELVELMQSLVTKIQEDSAENFTQAEDTISANTTEQLTITESENSQPKKKRLKV